MDTALMHDTQSVLKSRLRSKFAMQVSIWLTELALSRITCTREWHDR